MQTSCVLSASVLNWPICLNRTLVWFWRKHTPLKGEARKEMLPSLWRWRGEGSERFIDSPHSLFFTRLCCLVLSRRCSLSAPQLQCHARPSLPHSCSCWAYRVRFAPSVGQVWDYRSDGPNLHSQFWHSLYHRVINLEISEPRSKASTWHLMSQVSSV